MLFLWGCCGVAVAGPSIPAAAAPAFSDPLSLLRPAAANSAGPVTGPRRQTEGAASVPVRQARFTVLGEAGAESLDETEPVEPPELRSFRFQGPSEAPLDGESAFSEGITGVPPGSSLADLARGLVNQTSANQGGGGRAGAGNARTTDALLGTLIDAALTELVIEIINPEADAEGLVTFSIAGFGSFTLMSSNEAGGLFLVDLDRGTAIKLSDSPGRADRRRSAAGTPTDATAGTPAGGSHSFDRFLYFLNRYILPVITSPITLAAIALFMMIWVVWRLSARE